VIPANAGETSIAAAADGADAEWRVRAFGEPRDVLSLEPSLPREPDAGEVRIRVTASGLNFLDVAMCRGEHPVRPELPYVAGAEICGNVVSLGQGVDGLAVGDRVAAINPNAYGCFASETVVPAATAYPVPEDVPDEHAAALLVTYQTAYVALHRRAQLASEEWLLVHAGAGALGTALIQLARAAGARVIATASGAKLDVCLAQGAEVAVDYRTEDFRAAVDAATGGRGVDVACDQIGGETLARSCECIGFEGRLVPLGWAGGVEPVVRAGTVVARNISVIGVSWGSTYPLARPDIVRDVHARLLELYRRGAVRPYVPHVWKHDELPEALQRVADGASVGKSVIRWPA
jgi:NADPH2:quinone reductase